MSYLSALLLIAILVFIHEFGHYYIGKRCGIGVREFSIGFGPKILGFRDKSGVLWKICILPFGGFVKFEGDLDHRNWSTPLRRVFRIHLG